MSTLFIFDYVDFHGLDWSDMPFGNELVIYGNFLMACFRRAVKGDRSACVFDVVLNKAPAIIFSYGIMVEPNEDGHGWLIAVG